MDDAAPGQRLQLAVECQCGPHRGHERALPGVLTRGTPYLTLPLPYLVCTRSTSSWWRAPSPARSRSSSARRTR